MIIFPENKVYHYDEPQKIKITTINYIIPYLVNKKVLQHSYNINNNFDKNFDSILSKIRIEFESGYNKYYSLLNLNNYEIINEISDKFTAKIIKDKDLILTNSLIDTIGLYLELEIYNLLLERVLKKDYRVSVNHIIENIAIYICTNTNTDIKEKIRQLLMVDMSVYEENSKIRSNPDKYYKTHYDDLISNNINGYHMNKASFGLVKNNVIKNYIEACLQTLFIGNNICNVNCNIFMQNFIKFNYPFLYFNTHYNHSNSINLRDSYNKNKKDIDKQLNKEYNRLDGRYKIIMHTCCNKFYIPSMLELSNDHVVPICIIKEVLKRTNRLCHNKIDTFHIDIVNIELMDVTTNINAFVTLKDNNKNSYNIFMKILKNNIIKYNKLTK